MNFNSSHGSFFEVVIMWLVQTFQLFKHFFHHFFLCLILILVTVVEYSFLEAVCGASLIMLHSNAIIFYYLMFNSIKNSSISSVQHFSLIFAIALVLYTAYLYMIRPRNLQDHMYTFITLLCFGYMLTPVIRFVLLHLLKFNYHFKCHR